MPSPFPGMDPYLESRTQWPSIHAALIAQIRDQLNRTLPEGFAAKAEERLYLLDESREIVGDAVVLGLPEPYGGAVRTDSPVLVEIEPNEVRELYLEIVTADRRQEVITVIELLSPVNKVGEGRERYLRKQRQTLHSAVHLLEIDLLRGGEHTVAVPKAQLAATRRRWDYLVCLRRANDRGRAACWPFTVRDPLPMVKVPLTDNLADIDLDLGAALTQVYDIGRYRRLVAYDAPPDPPLSPADAAWTTELLQALVSDGASDAVP